MNKGTSMPISHFALNGRHHRMAAMFAKMVAQPTPAAAESLTNPKKASAAAIQ